jgi:hypothetical protein
MYIPDPIEIMEASAERWADENIEGNMFKCGCGKMCKLDEGNPIDSNPYSPPVCPDCFEEWLDLQEKKNDKKTSC